MSTSIVLKVVLSSKSDKKLADELFSDILNAVQSKKTDSVIVLMDKVKDPRKSKKSIKDQTTRVLKVIGDYLFEFLSTEKPLSDQELKELSSDCDNMAEGILNRIAENVK